MTMFRQKKNPAEAGLISQIIVEIISPAAEKEPAVEPGWI